MGSMTQPFYLRQVMITMNTTDLVNKVSQDTQVDTETVNRILKTAFSTIKRQVKKQETVTLRNFGTFQPIGHYATGFESDKLWCRLRNINQQPLTVGYSPEQWSHTEFYPTKDWNTFGEKWCN